VLAVSGSGCYFCAWQTVCAGRRTVREVSTDQVFVEFFASS
jgi:hypothetical protein